MRDKTVACDLFTIAVLLWFQIDCEMYTFTVSTTFIYT